jgi:hypothetical protein
MASGGRGEVPAEPVRATCAASAFDSADGDGVPSSWCCGAAELRRGSPPLELLMCSMSRKLPPELFRENDVSGRSGFGK